MDVALIRTADYDCHARDLSALVDLVSHGDNQVRTGSNQRVEVGHHAALPDNAVGPIELGIPGASHHFSPVVDAAGYGTKISRQRLKTCEYVVLPDCGIRC